MADYDPNKEQEYGEQTPEEPDYSTMAEEDIPPWERKKYRKRKPRDTSGDLKAHDLPAVLAGLLAVPVILSYKSGLVFNAFVGVLLALWLIVATLRFRNNLPTNPIVFIWLPLLLSALYAWHTFPAAQDAKNRAKQIAANAGKPLSNICTTLEGGFFAYTEADLDLAMNMVLEHDKAALAKLISQKRVVIFRPGVEVSIVESGWSTVKIRPKGHTAAFFSKRHMLDCE